MSHVANELKPGTIHSGKSQAALSTRVTWSALWFRYVIFVAECQIQESNFLTSQELCLLTTVTLTSTMPGMYLSTH